MNMFDFDNYCNNACLPFCAIGGPGSGKTTFLKNYAAYCAKYGESLFVVDFINNCELSESIKEVVPNNKIIELDLASPKKTQGFGFNEMPITDDMTDLNKIQLANYLAIKIIDLVDSIQPDYPLTTRMKFFLMAAASVVFVQKKNTLKNVIECLEDYEKRIEYIGNLTLEQKYLLEEEVNALDVLNKYSKENCGTNAKVIGTCSEKIEPILDRIALLRDDFVLKFMYNLNLDNNVNFVDCINKGKIVLLKMRESEFPTKVHKNILSTYFINKIWLASKANSYTTKEPLTCNVFIDEVFRAPSCVRVLDNILPQSRIFNLKFLLTSHHVSQIENLVYALEASRANFLLLQGCDKNDFNRLKDTFSNFQFNDLLNMSRFHAMCSPIYSSESSSFISKLPLLPKQEQKEYI